MMLSIMTLRIMTLSTAALNVTLSIIGLKETSSKDSKDFSIVTITIYDAEHKQISV
jgi:hypothetical protein